MDVRAVTGAGVRLRRAHVDDVPFLVELLHDEDVGPFLAAGRPRDEAAVRAEVERSLAEPDAFGRFVIEVEGEHGWERAGALGFELSNRRSRIARLGGLAVLPAYRGRRIADDAARLLQRHLFLDLDLHRLELECYGFNHRAIRHAERSGFVREGVKRRAYRHHGEWVDGIFFALLREDLEAKD